MGNKGKIKVNYFYLLLSNQYYNLYHDYYIYFIISIIIITSINTISTTTFTTTTTTTTNTITKNVNNICAPLTEGDGLPLVLNIFKPTSLNYLCL